MPSDMSVSAPQVKLKARHWLSKGDESNRIVMVRIISSYITTAMKALPVP